MTIHVDIPGHGYDIHVGAGVLSRVGPVTADVTRALQTLVVTQQPIADHWLEPVVSSLDAAGFDVTVEVVPDGEQSKDVETLSQVWAACAREGLQRRDAIVALGGGVVGDLAGLAAATYNRGIDLVQVPTTLLAQVDASIGGKTGIDLPSGKNLVGAIHQPVVVVSDTDTLATLSPRVLREGFGEVVKHALLADAGLFDELTRTASSLLEPGHDLSGLVATNAAIKAKVVSEDEREKGRRIHLNLGHTYAHALEAITGYETWLHGEAVAVGLLVALALGERLGLHGPKLRRDTMVILEQLGLPTAAPVLDKDKVHAIMARDKKADGRVRVVVLERLGSATVVKPSREDLDAAIAMVEDAAVVWPRPPDGSDESQ